jgi:signal peptidase
MGVIAFLSITVIIIAASCLVLQYKPAIVVSGSMEPMIKTGSLLLVDKKDKNIEIGDVIAYKNHDMEVSHRVVEITSNGYVTKGDNNDNVDFYQV